MPTHLHKSLAALLTPPPYPVRLPIPLSPPRSPLLTFCAELKQHQTTRIVEIDATDSYQAHRYFTNAYSNWRVARLWRKS